MHVDSIHSVVVKSFSLAVCAALCGCATSTLPLEESPSVIRSAILSQTPIGTSLDDADPLIQAMRPKSFKSAGSSILCQLGETDRNPPVIGMSYKIVEACWDFDRSNRLENVIVRKYPAGIPNRSAF